MTERDATHRGGWGGVDRPDQPNLQKPLLRIFGLNVKKLLTVLPVQEEREASTGQASGTVGEAFIPIHQGGLGRIAKSCQFQ